MSLFENLSPPYPRPAIQTVLVVDDQVLVRMVIADALRDGGYHVIEAGSADEAMELLAQDALSIDLVFSDIQMPGRIDGVDLARWLRSERPAVAVILTSGGPATAARHPSDEPPDWLMMDKPYSLSDVVSRVRGLLQA